MKKLLGVVLGMLFWSSASAVVLEGYEFPETVKVESDGPTLKLQGASVRTWYLAIKGYVGALYLQNPSSVSSEILADDSHQRMTFTLLFDKMSARRVANSFYEAIQINTSEEEQIALQKDFEKFLAMQDGAIHRGEASIIEFIPGKGTQVTVAGEKKGVIPDKRLFNALLRVWIGETPPTQKFKDEILGVKTQA
ncbi:MAG: chalcone isomerase family protein [Endozoicomonas sp.]